MTSSTRNPRQCVKCRTFLLSVLDEFGNDEKAPLCKACYQNMSQTIHTNSTDSKPVTFFESRARKTEIEIYRNALLEVKTQLRKGNYIRAYSIINKALGIEI